MEELLSFGGVELEYFSFGSGERTFVILPGLGTRSILFSRMMISAAYKRFGDDFTVYVFDRRKNLPPVYTVREMARDTANAIRELGLKNGDIFGASLGGMTAQYIAIDSPELVRSLVLGSTASRVNKRLLEVSEKWADAADSGDLNALTESFLKLLYCDATIEKYGDLLARMNDGLTEEELRRFSVQARAISDFDAYSELEKIKCPALVIGVEGDKVVTADASREIADKLGCEIFLYPDAYGHCVFDEAPDYKDRILNFLYKQ